MVRVAKTALVLTLAGACSLMAFAQEHHDSGHQFQLSPDLTKLLQAEMRELLSASQSLVLPIVSGDWEVVQRTSKQIRDSYVMAQQLSDSQRKELNDKLPDRFKQLDMEFHARAERLSDAAADKDQEAVNFHYYRLLETCATCHEAFATSRFPGLTLDTEQGHHH